MFRILLSALISLASLGAFSSCAGYHLGNAKPAELSAIHSIAVPLFENETQQQRLAQVVTNSMVDAITRDGTYSIASSTNADATLVGTIKQLNYSIRRNDPFDSLLATEMYLNMRVDWQLVANDNSILASGSASGRTQFSVDKNQQTSRTNAYPDAARNAALLIMQRIANGF